MSLETFGRASMKDKTVAILENRMGDHIASLARKYGGTPFSAPALAEIPDVAPAHIDELIRDWNSAPPDIFIFQTGVGTREATHPSTWRMFYGGRACGALSPVTKLPDNLFAGNQLHGTGAKCRGGSSSA
jgi:hypothetical protein